MELFEKAGNDLHRFFENLRRQERKSKRKIVRRKPRMLTPR